MSDLTLATKLIIIIQNQVGSRPGVWSRSLCLTRGLHVGGMVTAIERAKSAGFAVAVLNPNTNSVASPQGKYKRQPIANSFSPENHVLYVWDTKIAPVAHLKSIYLLTNGNGSSLAVDIVKLSYNTRHIRPKCTHRFKGRWCDVQKIPMNPCVSAPLLASSPHSL